MELEPYFYKLLPALADTGSFVELEDCLKLESFEKGARCFVLENGISFRLVFTNTGDAVLATGSFEAIAKTECDRCLDPASLDIAGELEAFILLEEDSFEEKDALDDYLLAEGPEGCIDIAPLVFSALILALPPLALCKEDCAGICPTCGAQLNKEACACAGAVDENHPFAALKNLMPNE
ncbi:MAG: DUF177 domain-containing protein [Coriobacteriia bacterium]|nr:DUF177 domain-containing protein [Coriobacteriia bacterium]